MHIDLILLTDKPITNLLLRNFNYKQLSTDHFLVNDYTLNNEISFDYIIIENQNCLKNINVLKDDDTVIVNCFFQTNLDHIFFVGKENKSNKTIDEQIDIILEFLYNWFRFRSQFF